MDVCTRLNSMYLMLDNAEKYEKAFEKMRECDNNFISDLDEEGPLTSKDWTNIRVFCKFLKVFYDSTNTVSASLHATSNLYVSEVCQLKMIIQQHAMADNMLLRTMALGMQNKFDKYRGTFERFNIFVFVAVLLDPRCKSKLLKHYLSILFGNVRVAELMNKVENVMKRLYLDFKGDSDDECLTSRVEIPNATNIATSTFFDNSLEFDTSINMSEIDEYMTEKLEKYSDSLDILTWWKLNGHKYPILSKTAKDVFIIPISTVASESAFSCGGRIVDSSRTSLLPTMVEAIICTQSWICSKSPTLCDSDYKTIDEEIDALTQRNEEKEKDIVEL